MRNCQTVTDQRAAWNQVSQAYNSLHEDSATMIRLAAQETQVILGSVAELDILEIGCGAGSYALALALKGARVTGVDISDEQIALAQSRVAEANANLSFLQADATDLSPLPDDSFNAIVAIYSLQYVGAIADFLAECNRLLRHGGRLIFAQDHPIRACFWDEEMQEESVLPARSYFDGAPLRWNFAGADVAMVSHHRTLAQWFRLLHENSFQLTDLRELPLPAGWADEPDVDEYTRDIARFLPQVLVLEATKP